MNEWKKYNYLLLNQPILTPNRYAQLNPAAIVGDADHHTEIINVEANHGQHIPTILNANYNLF
jgi:hypothetical protein